jgi:hypothetical protein
MAEPTPDAAGRQPYVVTIAGLAHDAFLMTPADAAHYGAAAVMKLAW